MSFIDWKDLFDEIFEDYSPTWTLTCLDRKKPFDEKKFQGMRKMERQTYAKFHCRRCSKTWASAKASVILYYTFNRVFMRLFGQQCNHCRSRCMTFVDPELDEEGIRKILNALHDRVGWDFYHKSRPKRRIAEKNGEHDMKGPHLEALCEACQLGCCEQSRAS